MAALPPSSGSESLFAFGWLRRWKNPGGVEMASMPGTHFDALTAIADDALALLDQHISDEQRREIGRRIIERMTFLERST